jgi:hypothetical protein
MEREAIFAAWAPPDGVWSLWARPVLFGQMPSTTSDPPLNLSWQAIDVSWAPGVGEKVVLIVDLPGKESVQTGLALAGRGYRPVPLYNGCTGPAEVINQGPIIEALRAGTEYLASLPLADAPPAFLLDALRMSPSRQIRPRDFDNRWKVFPQDFPSAAFLTWRGFLRAVLLQRGRKEPREDLALVLRRWQEAGITIEAKDVAEQAPPALIRVAPPPWYRRLWLRVLEFLGLDPRPSKGFGSVVPEPHQG